MDSRYEQRLEAEIDRAMKSLPEVQAPSTLVPRVSAAIAQRRSSPWHRQPWHAWPVPMRAAALVVLAAFFVSLCLGVWRLPETQSYLAATRPAADWFSGLTTLWNALNALLGALAQAVLQLHRGILLGCLTAVALAWAMCLGLGTVCLRLVLARR